MNMPSTSAICVAAAISLAAHTKAHGELEWQQQDKAATVIDTSSKSISKKFSIRNVGTKPAKIQRVEADCPCISILSKVESVPAGGSCEIEVLFEPGGRVGSQRKRISVFTNDVRDSAFSFTWDIKITEIVRIQPMFIHWPRNAGGETKEARVDVVLSGAKVKGWRLESDAFRAKEEKIDSNAMKFQVTPVSALEALDARLIIDVSMPDQTTKSYPLRLIVR